MVASGLLDTMGPSVTVRREGKVEKEGRVDAAERKRIKDNEIADRIEDLRAYLKTPTATCPWEDIPYLLDQLTQAQGRIAELEEELKALPEQVMTFIEDSWYIVQFLGAEEEVEFDELMATWELEGDAWLGKQQPTTLTKEGGD